jgi:hypothetical protein
MCMGLANCVVCGARLSHNNITDFNHHCPPATIARIEGIRKGYEDREPRISSTSHYGTRIQFGLDILNGSDDYEF